MANIPEMPIESPTGSQHETPGAQPIDGVATKKEEGARHVSEETPKDSDEIEALNRITLAEEKSLFHMKHITYVTVGILVVLLLLFDAFQIVLNRNSLKNEVLSAEDDNLAIVSQLVHNSTQNENLGRIEQDLTEWVKRSNHSISRIELKMKDGTVLVSVGDPVFEGENKLSFFEEVKRREGDPLLLEIYTDKNHLVQRFRQVTPMSVLLMVVFGSAIIFSFVYVFRRYAIIPLRDALREKNKAQMDLREQQKTYYSLVEEAPEMIIRYDTRHKIQFANHTFADFVGKSVEEVIGKNLWGFFSREAKASYVDSLQPLTTTNPDRSFTCPIVRKDNAVVWYQWTEHAYYDKTFRVLYFQMVGTNVDSIKHKEHTLNENEKRLRDVLDSSGEFVWEADAENKFTYVSQRLCDLTGYGLQDFIGSSILSYMDSQESERVKGKFAFLLSKQLAFGNCEKLMRKKSSVTFWVSLSAMALRDASGNFLGYRGSGKDITEQKKMDMQLVQAKDAAERSSKAKGDFLSIISSELRTPLNTIVGCARMIMDSKVGTTIKDYAEHIVGSSDALLDIINRILDFAQLESGKVPVKKETANLHQLIENIVQNFVPVAVKKKLAFRYLISGKVPVYVSTDASRVRQILFNLVSNAVKFTETGSVELIVDAIKEATPDGKGQMEYITFRVKDTGIGIAKEDMSNLFRPFSQMDATHSRLYGGVGLGLATVKVAVDYLQGLIAVKSEKGKGTEMGVKIPLVLAESNTYQDEEKLIPGIQELKGRKLLVYTENEYEWENIQHALQRWGVEAVLSKLPKEWKALKEYNLSYSAVLLDGDLVKENDAKELNKEMKDAGKDTPFIIMRAPCLTADGQLVSYTGDSNQISKPIFAHSLLFKLLNALRIAQKYELAMHAVKAAATAEEKEQQAILGSVNVLIAEDNGVNRKVVRLILERMGMKTDEAENGAQALEMLRVKDYQFIIMDLQMPEMDGYRLTSRIRNSEVGERNKRAVIAALTAHVLPVDQEKCQQIGMNAFIGKPVNPYVLEQYVKNTFVAQAVRT